MTTPARALSAELARAIDERLEDLERQIDLLLGTVGPSSSRLRRALEVIEPYPVSARAALAIEFERAADEVSRVDHARNFLLHATQVEGLVEDWLTRSLDSPAPVSLTRALERECDLLGQPRSALLSVGSADNYVTYIGELATALYGISPRMVQPDPELANRRFALMRLPRSQAGRAAYWPVILGHELAHLALLDTSTIASLDVRAAVGRLPDTSFEDFPAKTLDARRLGLQQIAEWWIEEILCDCYAVRRFGPAALASIASVLDGVGATFSIGESHPPGQLRIKLMLEWLESGWDWAAGLREPWASQSWDDLTWAPTWARTLCGVLLEVGRTLPAVLEAEGWPDAFADTASNTSTVTEFSRSLLQGRLALPDAADAAVEAQVESQVVNGLWVAAIDPTLSAPVDRLAVKSLDTLNFLRSWKAAGGAVDAEAQESNQAVERGALSALNIQNRLAPDTDDELRLRVSPLLPGAVSGAALDVRLGSSFIVFRRVDTPSIDPIAGDVDPRVMQSRVERDWGQPFVLHPGEMVLAATLEYIVMPPDLSAQVVTRSSYGRLGLITATAVLVHPHYRGSLTLELVNLGVLPITLTPGQRIAQLLLMPCTPAERPPSKYDCPTIPEFSKVGGDQDAPVLTRLRRQV